MKRVSRSASLAPVFLVAFALGNAAGQSWKSAPVRPRPLPEPGGAKDLLILRDGSKLTGVLLGCVGESCSVNGVPIARPTIEWIGFRGATPPPPQVQDPTLDEVFLSGSTEDGAVIGVSAHEVVTQRGSYPRDGVRWIHLVVAGSPAATPIVAATPGSGTSPTPDTPPPTLPPTPPPTRPPTPPPSPPSTPPPTPPRGTPTPGGGDRRFELGRLWSGQIHIHMRQTSADASSPQYIEMNTDVSAHLREFRHALLRPTDGKRFGTIVQLEPEGTEVRSKFESDLAGEYAGSHCDGSGTISLTVRPDEAGYNHPSAIYISNVDADTTPWIGFPIPRGTPRYVVGVNTRSSDRFTATCNSWQIDSGGRKERTWTDPEPYWTVVLGKPLITGCLPSLRHVCDPEIRTIQGENGRMRGSFHNSWDDNGFHHDLEVRWSLCRDDAPCKDEPPAPEKTPCQGTGIQDGLLQQCRDAERSIEREMKPHWDEYQKESHEASRHLADYKLAKKLCTAWDVTMEILDKLLESEMFLEGLPPNEAEEVKEFKEALEQLKSVIDNLYEGKSAAEPFESDEIAKIGEYTEKINKLLETLHLFLNGSPEELAEKLQDCGAPLPDSLYESARQYLTHLQASLEALKEVNKLMNDLRSKENECLQKQWDAYQACLDDAACKALPASKCDGLKPPGNWAPPR